MKPTNSLSTLIKNSKVESTETSEDRFCILNVFNAYEFKISPFRKLVPDLQGFYSPQNQEEIDLLEYHRSKGRVYKESDLQEVETEEQVEE